MTAIPDGSYLELNQFLLFLVFYLTYTAYTEQWRTSLTWLVKPEISEQAKLTDLMDFNTVTPRRQCEPITIQNTINLLVSSDFIQLELSKTTSAILTYSARKPN